MIRGRFPGSYRLRKSSQFQSISKNSHTFHGKVLFIVWKANGLAHSRLGITVTKKFGDAHVRNRFKRLVREGFRCCLERELACVDIHVRPKVKKELPQNEKKIRKNEGQKNKEGKNKRGKNEFLPPFADVIEDLKVFFAKFTTDLAS